MICRILCFKKNNLFTFPHWMNYNSVKFTQLFSRFFFLAHLDTSRDINACIISIILHQLTFHKFNFVLRVFSCV